MNDVCEWRLRDDGYYYSSCAYIFYDNESNANGKICPRCKKPIRVIEENEDG